jgi:hypothetical protein
VADADEADVAVAQRAPDREVVNSGQAEAHLDAGLAQRFDDVCGAGCHDQDQ